MANKINTVESLSGWETLEDALEHDLFPPPGEPAPADWFVDCEAYSLPKECMPGWRTVH